MKPSQPTLKEFSLAVLGAVAVYVLIFPDLFFFPRLSLLANDTKCAYIAAFSLVNQFSHGTIGLWDQYDQVPLSFYYLTIELNSFFSLLTASVCAFLIHFSDFPGKFFMEFFSRFYFLSLIAFRAAGCYLLLRKFTAKKRILIPGVIYLASFLSVPTTHDGMNSQSFYPLIVYLILVTVERYRIKDFAVCLLSAAVQLGSCLLSFIYNYQALHFFILTAFGWSFLHRQTQIKTFVASLKQEYAKHKPFIITCGVVAVLIVLPSFILMMTNFHDLNFKDTRTNSILNLAMYIKKVSFNDRPSWVLPWESHQVSGCVFLGYAVLVSALYGLLMSKDSRKYIFFISLLLSYAAALSWFPLLGKIGHLLNFATNPISFMVNDIRIQFNRIEPYLIFPLCVLGLEEILRGQQRPGRARKMVFVTGCGLMILAGWLTDARDMHKPYLIIQACCVAIFCAGLWKSRFQRMLLTGAIIAMVSVDLPCLWYEAKVVLNHSSDAHWFKDVGDLGIKNYDDQNPLASPFRNHFSMAEFSQFFGPCNMPGLYLHFTSMSKNFIDSPPGVESVPLSHKAYGFWRDKDERMAEYLKADDNLIFEAQNAVPASAQAFDHILDSGKARRVVMIEAQDPALFNHGSQGEPAPKRVALSGFNPSISDLSIDNGLAYFHYRHQGLLPVYTSTFLTHEDFVKVYVVKKDGSEIELMPSMGKPIEPFSYDINNYAKDSMIVALPVGYISQIKDFLLTYVMGQSEGVLDVSKNTGDHLRFDYLAAYDGWLVIHSPYDLRWRVKLNGKTIKFYKANKSFIGFPISTGTNDIQMDYMAGPPGMILRLLVFVSMLLVVLATIWLFVYGFKALREGAAHG